MRRVLLFLLDCFTGLAELERDKRKMGWQWHLRSEKKADLWAQCSAFKHNQSTDLSGKMVCAKYTQ